MKHKKRILRAILALATGTIAMTSSAYARNIAEVLTHNQVLHRAAINETYLKSDSTIVRTLIQKDSEAMIIKKTVSRHARARHGKIAQKVVIKDAGIAPFAVEGKALTNTEKIRLITKRENGIGPCEKLHTHAKAECFNREQMKRSVATSRTRLVGR